MDFSEIRKSIIIAMFSDDVLIENFVLKGGNALEIVYGLIQRGSLDIDLAIKSDFSDIHDTEQRLFRVLNDTFARVGLTVFDFRFSPRPRKLGKHKPAGWGGYLAEFKLISQARATELLNDLDRMRREAHPIGPGQQRIFRIEISKFEFCTGKQIVDLDGHTISVYTPEMLAIEKLRALCQQLQEYLPMQGSHRPRARDFYDIYCVVERLDLDLSLPENLELCRNIFSVKEVSVALISKLELESTREFHRPDWDRVRLAVPGRLMDFDFYFDYLVTLILPKLESLWNE